jgi:hypothetical protein
VGKTGSFVLVVGHRALVDSPEGAAALLRQLGSEVRTLDLWDDFVSVVEQARADGEVRTMVFEAGERPDLAAAALRAARKVPELSDGIWTCGKDGQSVQVGVGCPTVKIDAITVGGTRLG